MKVVDRKGLGGVRWMRWPPFFPASAPSFRAVWTTRCTRLRSRNSSRPRLSPVVEYLPRPPLTNAHAQSLRKGGDRVDTGERWHLVSYAEAVIDAIHELVGRRVETVATVKRCDASAASRRRSASAPFRSASTPARRLGSRPAATLALGKAHQVFGKLSRSNVARNGLSSLNDALQASPPRGPTSTR